MTLYEIANNYNTVLELLDNEEITPEAVVDTLEGIAVMIEEKADNIACLIKNLTAEIEAIKAEEEKLAKRRKSKEKHVEYLKAYLSDKLIETGLTNIETARNKITFRKSERVTFDNEADFIEWALKNSDDLLTYKSPTVNKTAIKKALADGKEIDGVHIECKMNMQLK